MLAISTPRSFSASQRLYWHRHSFFELGIVLSGEADWRIGKTARRKVQVGQAILLKPGAFHCEEVRPGHRCLFAWLGFESAAPPPPWIHRAISLGRDFEEVRGTFQTIAREHSQDDPLSILRLQLALQSLLLLVARQAESRAGETDQKDLHPSGLSPRQVGCVEAAAHYFTNNLRDSLSVAQVAAYHSMGAAHFSRLFRKHYGVPPQAFLCNARLLKARELLSNWELPVKEIAAQCGFVDSAHFCRVFKKATGGTPKQYRKARGSEVTHEVA